MDGNGFFEILDRLRFDGGRATGTIDPTWAQGRATFGGLVTAIGIRGMRSLGTAVDTGQRKLRSVLTSFVGPVEPGGFELRIERLREGRSASHVEARLIQNGEVRCITLGNFGARRQSTVAIAGPIPPAMTEAEALHDVPFVSGISPSFTRYFQCRWAIGDWPYSGSSNSEIGGWCRHRAGADSTEEAIAGLVDAWPAPVIQMLRTPGPLSSATWSLDFADPDEADEGAQAVRDGWWAFHGVAEAAGHGYAQARSRLWTPSGKLAAIGQQTFAVFG